MVIVKVSFQAVVFVYLFVFIVFIPSVIGSDYFLEEDADDYAVVQGDYNRFGNPPSSFNMTIDYNIPDYAIISEEDFYWYVVGGYNSVSTIFSSNITLNDSHKFNSTTYRLRVESRNSADYEAGGQVKYYYNNGSGYELLDSATSSTDSTGSCPTSNDKIGYLYDGSYSTGVVGYDVISSDYNGVLSSTCNEPRDVASTVFEESVYWYSPNRQQVVFKVKNEFGNNVEDATVTIKRVIDSKDLENKTTDVTGQVLYTLNQDFEYNITVSKVGYQNISGVVNIIDQSYTLTLTADRGVGEVEKGVFNNISFITSPSDSVNATNTNFTLNIASSDDELEFYGVTSSFNGSVYTDNNSDVGGGVAQITIDLSGHDNDTLLVTYYMKKAGYSLYQQNHYFVIGGVNATQTSITSLLEDNSDFSDLKKAGVAMIVLLFVVIILATAGIPGDWAAGIGGLFVLSIFLWTGWIDRVIAGISMMIVVGWLVMSNRGGGA